MRSTGFGSFIQKIVVTVPQEHVRTAAERLGSEPSADPDDPERAVFEVAIRTTRTGDDEAVVWEICHRLGESDELGWSIKWAESDY